MGTSKLLVQVKLRSGTTERTCWIDNADVKTGYEITLKNSEEPGRRWRVITVSTEAVPPERGWHAGGL
jgi:hypothetical protein